MLAKLAQRKTPELTCDDLVLVTSSSSADMTARARAKFVTIKAQAKRSELACLFLYSTTSRQIGTHGL